MSVSFKKFVEFIDAPLDMSDNQITEIFGIFKNNQKLEKLKAEKEALHKKKVDAEKARRDVLWANAKKKVDDKEQSSSTSAAAQGRRSEIMWAQK